jgi:hypothetical protein
MIAFSLAKIRRFLVCYSAIGANRAQLGQLSPLLRRAQLDYGSASHLRNPSFRQAQCKLAQDKINKMVSQSNH